MPNVVGVRFKRAGKVYYFDPGEWEFHLKDPAIVETARGIEFGTVVVGTRTVPDEEIVTPLKKVIRRASEADVAQVEENRIKEWEAAVVARQKISEHNLEMDLVDVEYTFDRSKVIFYFTAEGRVDFRDLVRDLASAFRTRIELRQIGVRDEAKILGGLGSCGRELCCATFLGDFAPVSIKMAKEQNLALNPVKISGLCGRLMCCLRYESGQYEEGKAALPEMGSTVVTAQGDGRVDAVNILRNVVSVSIEGKGLVDFPPEEVEVWKPGTPRPAVPQQAPRDPELAAALGEPENQEQHPAGAAIPPRQNGWDGQGGDNHRRDKWVNRGDRGGRQERRDQSERVPRPERPDQGERVDRAERIDHSDRGATDNHDSQSRKHRRRKVQRLEVAPRPGGAGVPEESPAKPEANASPAYGGHDRDRDRNRGRDGARNGGRGRDQGRAQVQNRDRSRAGSRSAPAQSQTPAGGGAGVASGVSGAPGTANGPQNASHRRQGGHGPSGSRRRRPDRRGRPANGAPPPAEGDTSS